MWQSTMVALNDSTVPPGLPLPECVVPQAASPALLGTKRLHSDTSFDPPCDSDDDTASTASCSFKSLDDFFVPEEPTTNKKKRRRVTFEEHARVAQVERLEKICWYSRRDLFTMKAEAKRKSRELNLDSTLARAYGMPLDNGRDEASLPHVASALRSKEFDNQRGLERWSSQMLMLSRCVTIVRARTEVHLEQINQTILGKQDPQRISELYKQASSQAGSFARVLAIADAAVLQED